MRGSEEQCCLCRALLGAFRLWKTPDRHANRKGLNRLPRAGCLQALGESVGEIAQHTPWAKNNVCTVRIFRSSWNKPLNALKKKKSAIWFWKGSNHANLKFALLNWSEDSSINHRQKAIWLPLSFFKSLTDKCFLKKKYYSSNVWIDNLKKSSKVFM